MTKQFAEDIRYFVSKKIYILIVFLAAAFSYGFQVTHVAVGIDDTATSLYFEEGLAPAVGRWTLYIINRLFHLSDFTPWMTDLAGVLLLIFAAMIWCVLLRRIIGDEISLLGYTFFAALFVTCPLISEVYVYYLHNGIGVGYVFSAFSLLLVQRALEKDKNIKMCCLNLLSATFLLAAAMGCYESFAIVYAIGALLLFIAHRIGPETFRKARYSKNVWRWGGFVGGPLVASAFMRMIMITLIYRIFGLSIPDNYNSVELRSAFSFFSGNLNELAMYFKRFWVKYYLNGLVYLPIAVLVFGISLLLLVCIVYGVKKRDIFLPLAAVAIPILPVLMIFVEGKESYYRASQYVPLVGAFGVFLMFWIGQALFPKWMKRVGVLLAAALLWNQCADMNRWFYVDYLKYEYFKNVMLTVANDLESDFDLSKPVIFGGACEVPYPIMKDACVDFSSPQYKMIRALGDIVDEHLIEKYNEKGGRGYIFAETPTFSTLQWGVTAFDGTAGEIQKFLNMLGYEIPIVRDLQKIEDAGKKRRGDMPHFPQEGYIQEYEGCLIVNF